jgi:hypothetical protein
MERLRQKVARAEAEADALADVSSQPHHGKRAEGFGN